MRRIKPPTTVAQAQGSDSRFRSLFENSLDAMVIADDQGRLLEVNQAACDLFGYSREAMLALRVGDLATQEAPGAAERYRAYLKTGREAGEFAFLRADGQLRVADYSACRLAPGEQLSILRDITHLKQAEERIRESETRFRLLVEQSPLSIQILSPEGHTLRVNRAWEELWGVTLEDLHDYNMLEDRQLVEKGIMPFIRRGFSGEAVAIPPILYDTQQTLPNRTKHSDPRRWTRAFMYPVKDEAGGIREVVLIHEDITERKRMEEDRERYIAEIERLNERLHQALQETHHRVKNNLQILAALVDVQTTEGQPTIPISALARLSQHIQALAAVHDLLTIQARDPKAEVVSVRALLEKLLPMLRQTIGERRLSYTLDDALLPIRQVSSLALCTNELVANAVKHGRGEVWLAFTVRDRSATLEVSDDGPGFPPDFDPDIAANTGLRIIRDLAAWDLGGRVYFDRSEHGRARVTLTLPLALTPPPP